MARLLVATVPLTGHVQPMLPLVRELIVRGHVVDWYGATKFSEAISATGARAIPMRRARDWDDAAVESALPELRGRRGLARVRAQLRAMFIHPAPDQLADLEAAIADVRPAAVIADSAHLGAALLAEKHRLPWAGVGISALMVPSVDTAPFGSAFWPARGWLGRCRNRLLNWLVLRAMFGSINRAYGEVRSRAGLPPRAQTYFEVMSPDLFLQPTVPAFEYPRRDLPSQVRFIGPLVPPAAARALPPWWPDVEAAHARGTPIVLVSQGTLATDPRELIEPALRGLADLDVLAIATGRPPALPTLPANARIAPFVPYQALMPLISAFVTNGGYGGVQMALQHGVPMVVAGGSEEKPEIAARVAWSGVGLDLRTGRPRPRAVRDVVRRVLASARYRERARAFAIEMARHDGPRDGAALVEKLVREPPQEAAT